MPNTPLFCSVLSCPTYYPDEPGTSAGALRLWDNTILFKKSYTVRFNDMRVRYLDKMYWSENTNDPSLENRMEFINQLIDRIRHMPFPKDRPLTIVSHAAEGLLTEYLIDQGLARVGFTDVRWRLMDYTCYLNSCQDNLMSFNEKVARRENVQLFNSDTEYFYRTTGGQTDAEKDREAGGTIILGCNSPPPLPFTYDRQGKIQPEEGLLLRGIFAQCGSGENSICVVFRHADDHHAFNKLNESMARSREGVYVTAVVRFSIQDSVFSFACSRDPFGRRLQKTLETAMAEQKAAKSPDNPNPRQEDISATISHIGKAIFAAMKLSPEPLNSRIFHFMDYDVSVAALRNFFRQGLHPHFYATMGNNHDLPE